MRLRNYVIVGAFSFLSALASSSNQDPARIPYCTLLAKSHDYDGKEVRVRAVYRFGAEWSAMYCPKCLEAGETWVTFDEASLETRSVRALKTFMSRHGGVGATIEGEFEGTFHDAGRYGHLKDYKYEIVINKVTEFHFVSNDSARGENLPARVLNKLCTKESAR